uniref:Uncharacterized protein n=1 Tax=Kalanchoe fedtschenkoi TaxID=63787 RepID=A0A7N0TK44_KALFE
MRFLTSLLSAERHSLDHFNQILSHCIVVGLLSKPFVANKLLQLSICHSEQLSLSRRLLLQIPTPTIFGWNLLFRAHSRSQLPVYSVTLYNAMRRSYDLLPDNYTFPFLLKACSRLGLGCKGQEFHCLSIQLGLEVDVFVQNALIFMYSSCCMIEAANRVFEMVPSLLRDVVSWNSVISGLMQCSRCGDAMRVFGQMLAVGLMRPNGVTLACVLTACGRLGLLDTGKIIHGCIAVGEYSADVYLGSSLIDMYGKCGELDDARKVFDRMPERNVVTWTSIIAGYAQSHLHKNAIQLFREMQNAGFKADPATISSVATACGNLGALDQGRWVHSFCERKDIEMNPVVKNAFIDMYSKCGEIEKALNIFEEMEFIDVFSWTAMISGLAMNGNSEAALTLFSQMQLRKDVSPNEVTFLGVLTACSHGGFVDDGYAYLTEMTQRYNLRPRIEHYGCVVDLLGRANLLHDAFKFITKLPIQPDAVMWRSLLFACRSHGNIELAEYAAAQIEKLDPRRCGSPVLLSNVYACAFRWGDVKRVRENMAQLGIVKQPGCSSIEINGVLHEFLVKDHSHGETNAIYQEVTRIDQILIFERRSKDAIAYLQAAPHDELLCS